MTVGHDPASLAAQHRILRISVDGFMAAHRRRMIEDAGYREQQEYFARQYGDAFAAPRDMIGADLGIGP
jgi:hypothetical protein